MLSKGCWKKTNCEIPSHQIIEQQGLLKKTISKKPNLQIFDPQGRLRENKTKVPIQQIFVPLELLKEKKFSNTHPPFYWSAWATERKKLKYLATRLLISKGY